MAKIYAYSCATEMVAFKPRFFATLAEARNFMKNEFIRLAKGYRIYGNIVRSWGEPYQWDAYFNAGKSDMGIDDPSCRYVFSENCFNLGFFDLSFVTGEIHEMDVEDIENVINDVKKLEAELHE